MIVDNAQISRMALQGKVIVVTGAGQGIGREAARVLAHLGGDVVIAEINEPTGRETEQLICAEGGRAMFVKTDVADPASVERLHRQVHEALGPVHGLVNNAEAFVAKAILEHSVEEWDRVFAVNLRGAFLLVRAFLPEMLERHEGVILTMESGEGMPYIAAYLASKVGLRSLALSLAAEIGEYNGVSVFCFGPGMVETPGGMKAFRQLAPQYGVSVEDFIRQSAPGGHLISAELCATGLAGTILHAEEFHGQEAYYVLGLAKLGLDANGEPMPLEASAATPEAPATPDESTGAQDRQQEAIALNHKMEEIMRANIKEYDELSLFQRPIVKRMFQQGTGLKVEDWLTSAQEMTRRLESATPSEPSALTRYIDQLKRMVDFIAKQETDARGWIKDPKQLQIALEALSERKATAQKLSHALSEMGGASQRG
jgi:NAD(P)-dependent dehydrogenase (short-subunit alcohol dehydrogenase family)